jgi:hypothetical protein
MPPIWGVAVTEKTPCWLRVIARGTPGHSSSEPRDAAAADRRPREDPNYESDYRVAPEVSAGSRLAPYARRRPQQLSDLAFWLD